MRKILIFILFVSIAISGCQGKTGNEKIYKVRQSTGKPIVLKSTRIYRDFSTIDFLSSLGDICVEDNGVFKNCDELFSKDGASLFFLIIPKMGAKNWYEAESKGLNGAVFEKNNALTSKVQSIDKRDLSKDFDVWVFYTAKQFTQRVDMDGAYNVKNPHVTELYYLKSGRNNWEKQDSFQVKNDNEVQKEIQWRDNFINHAITLSNQKSQVATGVLAKVPEKWTGKYSAYFTYGPIASQIAGWSLEIEVRGNKVMASGDGYQMAFVDELSANEGENKLVLNHLKHVSGYKKGASMHPEFTLIKDNGVYYVKSQWIDGDIITKPKELGYEIERTQLPIK